MGLAIALAAIPLAVGLGVLVGRASTSGDDKLIAALRAQKPEVITTGGGVARHGRHDGAQRTASPVAALTSNFPLQSGYTVELQTLPRSSTAAVTKAEQAAASRGRRTRG